MDTALTVVLIVLFYFAALALFMRFFAFLRSCDSGMRLMISDGKKDGRFPIIGHKKKKIRKARAPRFVAA